MDRKRLEDHFYDCMLAYIKEHNLSVSTMQDMERMLGNVYERFSDTVSVPYRNMRKAFGHRREH